MCRHYTRRDRQDSQNVILDAKGGADVHHHAGECDLVEVVVQDLAKWAAVVGATCLLPINGVNGLVPKVREHAQEPNPAGQPLREGRIQ